MKFKIHYLFKLLWMAEASEVQMILRGLTFELEVIYLMNFQIDHHKYDRIYQ